MKTIRPYSLLILFIAIGFSACKKDSDEQRSGLIGKWVSQYPYEKGKIYQDIYQFNTDSSFSQTRLLVDSVSGQPVAYQYYSNGKFHLNANKLQLYAVSIKYSDHYGTFDQLTKVQLVPAPVDYTIELNNEEKKFKFIFPPCPINALCVATLTYYKKQ